MKKGRIFTNCLFTIWTMCLITALASCSADSEGTYDLQDDSIKAEAPFSLILKVYSENENITANGDVDNTTLYIFDDNNDFYKQITVDRTYPLQVKPVEIDCPGSDHITVIAWSGISSDSEIISSMSNANIIEDLQLNLKQNEGIASNFPTDLFYGQATLYRNTTKAATQELKISRKVASLNLTTKGIIKMYDSNEGSYFYKVKKTKSSFNHNGELTGNDVEYVIPATLNSKGVLTASTTAILPTSDITVELYRNDEMILSSKNVKNQEIMSVSEGEQLCISFDLTKQTSRVLVSSWGVIVQTAVVD